MATSGSAQAPSGTLHFVGKSQNKVGFFPKHRPHQGDRFGFGDKVSGDDTGVDRGVCTFVGKQSLCDIQVQLSTWLACLPVLASFSVREATAASRRATLSSVVSISEPAGPNASNEL